MTPEEKNETARQLARLRRETHKLRRWIIFATTCLAFLLIFPGVTSFLSTVPATALESARDNGFAAPILGVLLVIIIGAIVVSQFATSKPEDEPDEEPEEDEED